MKKEQLLGVLSACLLFTFGTPASAVTIDYSNIAGSPNGSTVNFDPDENSTGCGGVGTVGCFYVLSASGTTNSIEVTSGLANGFLGSIDGVFGVGPITTVSSLFETATVSGTGTLSINDGTKILEADLVWADIYSAGTGGGANIEGTANLANIIYDGSNDDLLALKNGGSGIQTLTYQFTSTQSLTKLFTTNTSVTSTSFSGSITPVPVPPAVWLFGSGLLGLVGIARRKAV